MAFTVVVTNQQHSNLLYQEISNADPAGLMIGDYLTVEGDQHKITGEVVARHHSVDATRTTVTVFMVVSDESLSLIYDSWAKYPSGEFVPSKFRDEDRMASY